jgi:hypothetical protein
MLTLKTRLPFNTTRIITTVAMMIGKEQKRYSSLTMETLNPLVKEVEYAVRGRIANFFLILITVFFFYIKGPIVIRAGDIEKQLKVVNILDSD